MPKEVAPFGIVWNNSREVSRAKGRIGVASINANARNGTAVDKSGIAWFREIACTLQNVEDSIPEYSKR